MIKKVIFIIVEVQKITFVGDYFDPKGYFDDKKGRKDYQNQHKKLLNVINNFNFDVFFSK